MQVIACSQSVVYTPGHARCPLLSGGEAGHTFDSLQIVVLETKWLADHARPLACLIATFLSPVRSETPWLAVDASQHQVTCILSEGLLEE